MKKTVLTLVAVAFGMSVAFAQTSPQKEVEKDKAEQSLTLDKMSDKPQEVARRSMKVEELPAAIQTNLKSDEFKNYKILTVTELQSVADAQRPVVQYEIALLEPTAEIVDVPSLVVLFDERGKLLTRTEAAPKNLKNK